MSAEATVGIVQDYTNADVGPGRVAQTRALVPSIACRGRFR